MIPLTPVPVHVHVADVNLSFTLELGTCKMIMLISRWATLQYRGFYTLDLVIEVIEHLNLKVG